MSSYERNTLPSDITQQFNSSLNLNGYSHHAPPHHDVNGQANKFTHTSPKSRPPPPPTEPPPPPTSKPKPSIQPPLDKKIHNEQDTKVHYVKLINEEFRNLQLDANLQSKSIFDLIDYCELLYEESSSLVNTEQGLATYIKGYLIFNYFINSFIMMHFEGFDQFIESNEQDFILYLNVFSFYNTDDIIRDDSYVTPLRSLRRWVLEYLMSKNLLSFDVNELYQWLFEYIDYLKQKELAAAKKTGSTSHHASVSDSDKNFDLQSAVINDIHNIDPLASDDESSANADGDDSIFEFKNRFPSVKIQSFTPSSEDTEPQHTSVDSGVKSKAETPALPDEAPPPVPRHAVNYKRRPLSTPYPLEPVAKVSGTPYPLSNASADDLYFTNGNLSDPALSQGDRQSRFTPHENFDLNISNEASKHNTRMGSLSNTSTLPLSSSNGSYSSSPSSSKQPSNMDFNRRYSRPPAPLMVNNQNHSTDSLPKLPPGSQILPSVPTQQAPHYRPQYNGTSFQQPQNVNGSVSHPNQKHTYLTHPSQHNTYPKAMPPQNFYYLNHPGAPPAHSSSVVPQHVRSQHDQIKNQKMRFMHDYSICGLRNLGSSCYINSTIQLLFGLLQFKYIFTNSEYHKYIKDPKCVRLLKLSQNSKDTFLLSEAISGLLKTFSSYGGSSVAPTKFLRTAASIKPDFNIPNEQQDAQEFLLFVLERLHEELSYSFSDRDIDIPTIEKYLLKWNINIDAKDKQNYLRWCQSLIKTEGDSPINDLFQGHLQNKLICNKCGYESINYSPFTILSLPIPSNNAHKPVDLADCLRYYTQDEVLTGENAWNCPRCNSSSGEGQAPPGSALDNHPVFTPKRSGIFRLAKRSKSPAKKLKDEREAAAQRNTSISIKTLMFIKLPQILLIHLSRFSMFNLTDKLDTVIEYPLELKFGNNSNGISHEISYKLVGLINHYGNLKSGHYTSLVNKSTVNQTPNQKNKDNLRHPYWCLFDDDAVKPNLAHGLINDQNRDCSHLYSRDVYVLCYERI